MADDFAAQCKAAAKGLRKVQPALRTTLRSRMREEVAEPLAGKIRTASRRSPWGKVLAPGTKTLSGVAPKIKVGGNTPRLSGGGGPRSVVFGAEFGGGKRLTAVPRSARHRGYRRYSTNQFKAHHTPFVFNTVNANMDAALDGVATIVLDVLDKEVPGG